VAAALLHKDGCEVIGVTLNLFAAKDGGPACCGTGEAGQKRAPSATGLAFVIT